MPAAPLNAPHTWQGYWRFTAGQSHPEADTSHIATSDKTTHRACERNKSSSCCSWPCRTAALCMPVTTTCPAVRVTTTSPAKYTVQRCQTPAIAASFQPAALCLLCCACRVAAQAVDAACCTLGQPKYVGAEFTVPQLPLATCSDGPCQGPGFDYNVLGNVVESVDGDNCCDTRPGDPVNGVSMLMSSWACICR